MDVYSTIPIDFASLGGKVSHRGPKRRLKRTEEFRNGIPAFSGSSLQ
jgi:hypothetical protein